MKNYIFTTYFILKKYEFKKYPQKERLILCSLQHIKTKYEYTGLRE